MKSKRIFILFLALFLFSCNGNTAKDSIKDINEVKGAEEIALEKEKALRQKEELAIEKTFGKYIEALETGDIELYSSLFAHDAEMVNFGIDEGEDFVGWEELNNTLRKQFKSYTKLTVTIREKTLTLHSTNDIAWLTTLLDLKIITKGIPLKIKGIRMTAIMIKDNGKWLFHHFHSSLPLELVTQ